MSSALPTFSLPGISEITGDAPAGLIYIEPGWQIIAVPTRFGYWRTASSSLVRDGTTVAKIKNYVVDQLVDKYGAGVVTVANAYIGDVGGFYSYVPGSTPEASVHNFPLMYEDPASSGNYEPVGFWIFSAYGSTMELEYYGDQS